MEKITRRQALKTVAVGTIGAAAAGCASIQAAPSSTGFSFVHMTDMHVRRKRKGDEGYRTCVAHVKALNPKPDFAMMGGDLAFDGLYTAKDEFEDAIGLYKTISDSLGFPYYNCIGNHDMLGLSSRRKVEIDDPDFGKKMIMDRLGMERTYYSFDHKGWHFVVLDCIYEIDTPDGPSYEPRIGEEQLAWLARDLGQNAGKPTVCMTHIAAFCNIGQINGDMEARAMNPGMVLRDNKELRLILERHGVKALLQGHSHAAEDFHYRGVWYLTSNAVSGCWWSGTWKGFPQGYTLFRCEGDQLTWERIVYPWTHHLEPEDTLERERIAQWEAFEAEQQALLKKERSA